MEQLFVTAAGQLMERWEKAFPGAQVVARVADIPGELNGVVWLDIGALPPKRRISKTKEAVSFGWPVVAMSPIPSEAEAFAVLKTGAVGYCHVRAAPEQLREIGLVVEQRGIWMPPELVQRLLKLSLRVLPGESPIDEGLNHLTARELMVAEQIATGATNREIAERLQITERTVKAHLTAIFEKLGVRDRVQLALAMNKVPTCAVVH